MRMYYFRGSMDQQKLSGTTYVFPDQMQPPIELENVKPTPSRGWPGVGLKGHVRSASHGGVSLQNPAFQPHHQLQPAPIPSSAIGLLEAAEKVTKDEAAATSSPPKLPYTGMSNISLFKKLFFKYFTMCEDIKKVNKKFKSYCIIPLMKVSFCRNFAARTHKGFISRTNSVTASYNY